MVYKQKYLDPLVLFSFQRIFAGPSSKQMLISFLNASLAGCRNIVDVTYNDTTMTHSADHETDDIIDILCTDVHGDSFFVGIQLLPETDLKHDPVMCGMRLIKEQKKIEQLVYLKFNLKKVYVVVLIAGHMSKVVREGYRHDINIRPLFPRKYSDLTLNLVFIDFALFNKKETELSTLLDKWVFALKSINHTEEISSYLQEPEFKQLFEMIEYEGLTSVEKQAYHASLKSGN
ncbi:PD-(D/E)XK nuclease family transposase [Pedobacter sp. AW31-3R]|uniref:PD-(D/E)XK nuclease family transposase n=1 Tax=Pedobacter sp. AW31-3R TaxID=3445781 RepID=UPI003FA1018C